jgi:hypothetical protein
VQRACFKNYVDPGARPLVCVPRAFARVSRSRTKGPRPSASTSMTFQNPQSFPPSFALLSQHHQYRKPSSSRPGFARRFASGRSTAGTPHAQFGMLADAKSGRKKRKVMLMRQLLGIAGVPDGCGYRGVNISRTDWGGTLCLYRSCVPACMMTSFRARKWDVHYAGEESRTALWCKGMLNVLA